MERKPSIFIAATGQNEGKTTSCLGILSGLLKRFNRVGFMKPVGQEHVTTESGQKVDKDVVLFKKRFNLPTDYKIMNPVLFDRGYTKRCIDGEFPSETLKEQILSAYETLSQESDCIVVEGTGHVGVGAVAGLSNADVAKLLDLNMILVTSAGIGSTYDAITLNKALCDQKGNLLKGVIINRLLENKRESTVHYTEKALKAMGLSLLGTVAFDRSLTTFCMKDFETLFSVPILSGQKHQMRHFDTTRLVATSVETYQKLIINRQLIITPSTREDIIVATLRAYWNQKLKDPESTLETGFIFTGSIPPSSRMIDQLKKAEVPALYSKMSSFNAMKKITRFTAKLQIEDTRKVSEAISLMESNIDFDLLISLMKGRPSL